MLMEIVWPATTSAAFTICNTTAKSNPVNSSRRIRKWHPALQDAWRQYQTLWELTITEKDWEEAHQLGLVESDVE